MNDLEKRDKVYLKAKIINIESLIYCSKCGSKKVFAAYLQENEKFNPFNIFLTAKTTLYCQECFEKDYGKEKFNEVKKIGQTRKEICSIHNKSKEIWKENKSQKLEACCFACDFEEWKNKLKHLKLFPLSIAKYFYEKWRVSDPVIMQRLIYFAYFELINKKNLVMFEEKFHAWPGGAVLESVIYPMYKNSEKLKNFFEKIKELNHPITINYLDKIADKYLQMEDYQIYKEARDDLWQKIYHDSSKKEDDKIIDEVNIFEFLAEKKRRRVDYPYLNN